MMYFASSLLLTLPTALRASQKNLPLTDTCINSPAQLPHLSHTLRPAPKPNQPRPLLGTLARTRRCAAILSPAAHPTPSTRGGFRLAAPAPDQIQQLRTTKPHASCKAQHISD